MSLRDYQDLDVVRIRTLFAQGYKRLCYQGATGSGKTVMFVFIARAAVARGRRVIVLVHRVELIDQTCEALAAAGVQFGAIAAGYAEDPDAAVQVAMAQTLVNRLDRLRDIHFLIVDECHHVAATTWCTILAALAPDTAVLGVSATPQRLDGRGLNEAFEHLVIGPSVKDLIAAGWLAPFVVYAPERMVNLKGLRTVAGDYAVGDLARRMSGIVISDAITEYHKRLAGKRAIAFCTTIEHSREVARQFRAAGIHAEHLDGDCPRNERRTILARLQTGATAIVTNCNLIGEGLDVPALDGVILLRPTKSLAVFLQQVGRALRPAPGKHRAVILDHSGNALQHGLPDLEHTWSLEGRPKTKGPALVRRCPECGALIPISGRTCPECAAELTPAVKVRMPAPLIELDPATAHERWLATGPFNAVTRWAGRDEQRLHAIAAARGYRPGWVWHRRNH
jgi:DNA repair protein RadD